MSDVTELVREAREIDAQVKHLSEQKAALVGRITKELGVGEKVVVDGVACSLRAGNRKFSLPLALKLLDDDLKLKCVVTTIDQKLVRQMVENMGLIDSAMESSDSSKTVLNLTS